MFGDKSIYGHREARVDDKNRVSLPLFSYREQGDSLVIIRNKESNSYDIYKTDNWDIKLKKQIKCLEERYNATLDEKKRAKIQLLLEDIYRSVLGKSECDKQGRINIGSILEEKETLAEVEFIGAYDHLMMKKIKKK